LSEDATGLKFTVDMPDTQVGRDLLVSVERGDISQNSFGFVVKEQTRSMVKGADGQTRMVREIVDCDLFDVSPVTYPAYTQTTLEARSAFLFPNGMPDELTELMSEQTVDDTALAALENVRQQSRCHGVSGEWLWFGVDIP
jgi:phage head maturation protease